MKDLKNYYSKNFESLIDWRLNSVSSLVASKKFGIEKKIQLIEWSHLYFISDKNETNILKFTYRGYDAISMFNKPSHGFIVTKVYQEEINNGNIHEGFYLSLDEGFVLKKVSIWSTAYKDSEFEKISNLLVLGFSNGFSAFFQLSDRQDADLIIDNITVENFFKNYPDSEERELILLYSIDENKN